MNETKAALRPCKITVDENKLVYDVFFRAVVDSHPSIPLFTT
jgi:hypothetical protein